MLINSKISKIFCLVFLLSGHCFSHDSSTEKPLKFAPKIMQNLQKLSKGSPWCFDSAHTLFKHKITGEEWAPAYLMLWSAWQGDIFSLAHMLLVDGVNPNFTNEAGLFPLIAAIDGYTQFPLGKHAECVALLLDCGADAHKICLFTRAFEVENYDVLSLLLERFEKIPSKL